MDAVAQAYMRTNIDAFDAIDFERSETTLRKQHQHLFNVLGMIVNQGMSLKDHLPSSWMKHEVVVRDRVFTVRTDQISSETARLNQRYTQSKSTRRASIEELVEAL